MKILIVTATELEMKELRSISSPKHELHFLVSGVGMIATTYSLANIHRRYKCDLAINCGIAGSFDRSIKIGEVVNVTEDIFSEPGAEDGDEFLNLAEIGLEGKVSFKNSSTLKQIDHLRKVNAITVNTVHGNETSIIKIIKKLNPQTESMEGAAFFYVCEKENIPALQLRAISNYIEKRNKESWNIPLALDNLTNALAGLVNKI